MEMKNRSSRSCPATQRQHEDPKSESGMQQHINEAV